MKVIKFHAYNIINAEPFDIPFPLVFELLHGNTLLAEYTISESGVVDYSFNPNTSEKILTSIRRPLSLNDIYFLFSTRIFPDKTPYTAAELERFELTEYQPYFIVRRTRGMLPNDKYWFRFENENIGYKQALIEHNAFYENSYRKYMESLEAAHAEERAEAAAAAMTNPKSGSEAQKNEIPEEAAKILEDNCRTELSKEMVKSLKDKLGSDEAALPEPETADGGMMSPDEIAALLAANAGETLDHPEGLEATAIESEPAAEFATPAPVSDANEKMSDDAIAALLAANQG